MCLWRNLKKGTLYNVLSLGAIDCTNSRDGTRTVIYQSVDGGQLFTREYDEFMQKFDPANPDGDPAATGL